MISMRYISKKVCKMNIFISQMHAKASQIFEKDIDKSFAYLISLFIFVDSETLKLDHFDEAGYTFIAPRLVNFPVVLFQQ